MTLASFTWILVCCFCYCSATQPGPHNKTRHGHGTDVSPGHGTHVSHGHVTTPNVLSVSTVLLEPYVMVRSSNTSTASPYYGYVIDLLDRLAEIVGFSYSLHVTQDGSFGFEQPDGSWNGIIGELVRKEADIGAGPLFSTDQRAQVVDFTKAFINVTAAVLLRRVPASPVNQLSLSSAYPRISSLSELLTQAQTSDFRYGTLNKGVIRRTLTTDNSTLLQELWKTMADFGPDVLTVTNEQGIERVRTDRFAFILPSPIADYIVNRQPCDLTMMEGFALRQDYAFAVQRHSPLLPKLNRALIRLRRNGQLTELYRDWWVKGDGSCVRVRKGMLTDSASSVEAPTELARTAAASSSNSKSGSVKSSVTSGSCSRLNDDTRLLQTLTLVVFVAACLCNLIFGGH